MKKREFTEQDHEKAARLFRRHYGDLADNYDWYAAADRETARLADEHPDMSVTDIIHAAGQRVRTEKIDHGRRQAVGAIIKQRNEIKEGKR